MKALCLWYEGCEEIESIAVVDILRRGGIKIVIGGEKRDKINGSRDISLFVEQSIDEIEKSELFDAVILPGGLGGVKNISLSKSALSLINNHFENGKLICAICAAPLVLEKLKILDKIENFTSHPAVAEQFNTFTPYSNERVVKSKNVITSRSPGTAIEFAFEILKNLKDEKTVEIVNKGVLANL
jgi:protein deglycase